MNDRLANDRTFLAWLRTGIALFGLGFVVSKVALIVDQGEGQFSDAGLYSGVGVLIVLSGAAVILVGYRQHSQVAKALPPLAEAELAPASWTKTIAVSATIGSLVLSALIIVTT